MRSEFYFTGVNFKNVYFGKNIFADCKNRQKSWFYQLSVSLNIVNFRTEISSFREILTEDQNINGVYFRKTGNLKDRNCGKLDQNVSI